MLVLLRHNGLKYFFSGHLLASPSKCLATWKFVQTNDWAPSHTRSLGKLSTTVFHCTSPLLLNPSISWLILDVLPLWISWRCRKRFNRARPRPLSNSSCVKTPSRVLFPASTFPNTASRMSINYKKSIKPLKSTKITKIFETDWKVNKDKVIGVLILHKFFLQSTLQNQCFYVIKNYCKRQKFSKSSHFSALIYKLGLM